MPAPLHESDVVPADLRRYLDRVADAIKTHVDRLAQHAAAERPAWTAAFGDAPCDETAYERWRTAIGLAAAHRDQHLVGTDDPEHPFGPYIEADRAGHRSWWAAASAALAVDNPGSAKVPTGLADYAEQELAHAIACDIYQALPEAERAAVHEALADRLGPAWALVAADPESLALQPVLAPELLSALAGLGHLGPAAAAELGSAASRRLRGVSEADAVHQGSGLADSASMAAPPLLAEGPARQPGPRPL
ncbi:hypothetical protein LO763_10070 [Glycomyces sp. A-F 0318]|uniref:hypothetical protein n=1 Tax=Glycomyces amatae TaxID=2881355 RepID=UPI001E5AEB80|nr:hypothetical protein [Glycomyces amatae]MCD0443969.1 hypothetical protein [Glycomyces amatae]